MHDERKGILDWKKGRCPFPAKVYDQLLYVLERFFCGFDLMTVPAPSFHDYESGYPIWELAKSVSRETGTPLELLFPEKSGKTKKHYSGWRQKRVQDISLDPGRFVLVLDDIVTTGNTMGITFEAILRKGSFPCGLALC